MASSFRVVALVSGGKDSCYSMIQCVSAGHTIVALANLSPVNDQVDELDSYMYQTVGHSAISLYAEAMGGLPLFRGKIKGSSLATTSNNYSPTNDDEVEDLYDLLKGIRSQLEFDAICTGAILSDYQRIRVENVCSRLGLVSLGYLWRRNQAELLDEMLDCGKLEAIIIKVATLGLDQNHLGLTLREIRPHLHKMHEKFGINVCGEGGEYETFTLDCPLFYKKLVLLEKEIVVHSDDAFAPVAFLKLKTISLEDKNIGPFSSQLEMVEKCGAIARSPEHFITDVVSFETMSDNHQNETDRSKVSLEVFESIVKQTPQFQLAKDFCTFYVSNLFGSSADPKEATREVFDNLKDILALNDCLLADILSVTLLVGDMSLYGQINSEYIKYFQSNPPVRVCVQADISFPIVLSACGHRHSQLSSPDGNVMHVQSISHWAPANIGPYSQAAKSGNTLYIAGQIGLVPGSMVLAKGLENQGRLAWRHLTRVLEVYKLTPGDLVQVVCFVATHNFETVLNLWSQQMEKYYDRESTPMIICVKVPRLPRDALIEWQVVALEDTRETKTTSVSYPGGFILDETRTVGDNGSIFTSSVLAKEESVNGEAKLEKDEFRKFWKNYQDEFFGPNDKGVMTVYAQPGFLVDVGFESNDRIIFVPVSDFHKKNIIISWTYQESQIV